MDKPKITIDGKETYVDFVEYVRDPETFADKEYKKWLRERDAEETKNGKSDETT